MAFRQDKEAQYALLGSRSDDDISAMRPTRQHQRRPFWASVALNVVLTVIIAVNIIVHLNSQTQLNGARRKCSTYSPVFDAIDLETQVKRVNGSLFPPAKDESIARQNPNKDADAIWAEWELQRVFALSETDIIKLGKDPSTVAKLEDSIWGLGDDAYAATLDVYHQLHCLNALRHIAYGNYYNRSLVNTDTPKPTMDVIHVNHCVDIIMQALQCSGNVNFMTLHWVETQTFPFPDMSVNRQCINFDKLTTWRKQTTIDMDKYVKVMKKPNGVKERPIADQFYEFHGMPNPNHLGGKNPGKDFNI